MDYQSRSARHHRRGQRPVTAPQGKTYFKLDQARAGSPGRDTPPRYSLPEWGSTKVEDDLVKNQEN